MPRLIAIGDIHGCDSALETLLGQIGIESGDTLVQLGDVIDRGPNSKSVVARLMGLRSKCKLHLIQGNHEELMFNALNTDGQIERWLRNGGDHTLASYGIQDQAPKFIPSDQQDFLASALPFYETDDFIFTHAGYEFDVAMTKQNELALKWRTFHRDTVRPHFSGKTVVVGHTVQRSGNINDLGFAICIDTNCCRGGWLTALDVDNRIYWQANEKKEHRSGSLSAA